MLQAAPSGQHWIIRGVGDAAYEFALTDQPLIQPDMSMLATKIPDSTPGIIARYAMDDEQALLAKVRYNRLIDIFTGAACYSLQSPLRSKVAAIGQVEVDELYVGVDRTGTHFVFPVQAKGGRDRRLDGMLTKPVVCFPNHSQPSRKLADCPGRNYAMKHFAIRLHP